MTVIVEQEQALVDTFQGALGGGGTVLASLTALEQHLANRTEHAVVLGPSVHLEAAAGFAEWARIHRPTLGVILVRTRVESSVLAEALRSGMREVVEARDLTGLGDAVRRAYSLAQAMTESTDGISGDAGVPQGRVYTVFATKGGVGKSTLATNLAVALADSGLRTVVVDLDVESGDVAIMLQLTPVRSLADLPSIAESLDQPGVESLLTPYSDHLSVLAAPLTLGAHDAVSPDSVGQVLTLLAGMVDVVVVDTSGSFDDFSLQALDHADRIVLIGTLDIPALKSLKLASGTLDLLNYPRDTWSLVLNRADGKVGLSAAEFESTLGIPVTCTLPSSREVLAAVNRGEPVVRASSHHAVSSSIRALATGLTASIPSSSGERGSASPSEGSGPSGRGGRRRLRLRK